jgi:hypothetical protein
MLPKHGLVYLKQMKDGQFCLKERCFDVFLERNKRTKYGEKDTTTNYTKYFMDETLSIPSKLKDWHVQGT